jgi:arylsulfatase A-like enzyme
MRTPASSLLAAAALVLTVALMPVSGCQPSHRAPLLDLARRTPVADLEAAFETVLFGTPAAEGLQENGFRREGRQDRGDVWAAAAPTARLLMRWPEPAPRLAVLDLEPEPGSVGEPLEVALNGRPIARLRVSAGRQRYAVAVPADVQRRGANRFRLVFGDAEPDASVAGAPSRARAYSLVVGAPGAALSALSRPEAPPVLSVQGSAPGDVLQAAPSGLYYAFALPRAAELRLTPALHAASGGTGAVLRVTLQEEGGALRELWSQRVAPEADLGEMRLALPGPAGAPVRLGLHVEGEASAWARWKAPVVWGVGEADQPLAAPEPEPPPVGDRLSAVRHALAGANVLLVVLDAAGARHMGAYGYARATTPEIDRIAREGVLFERAYTPAVFTYAAIASLWTSQVPDQGHSEWLRDGDGMLPADRPTLAEALTAHGIPTAAFVANPSASVGFGLHRGFAEFHPLYQPPWSSDGVPGAETFRRALHPWLARAGERPFFAYAHFREPHSPYQPPPPFTSLFSPPRAARPQGDAWQEEVSRGRRPPTASELDELVALYDANLAFADAEVGRLRATLERAGLWDRTLVIVTADHGEAMYEHGWIGHNTQVYDESARIPLIMKFPGAAGVAGTRVADVTGLLDLAPTIADAFGLPPSSVPSFRGRSLLPACVGAGGGGSVVSRTSGWTYGLVHGRYKLVHDLSSARQELYDLEADPQEKTDLAAGQPLRAAVYRQALHRWLLDLRGPRPPVSAPVQLDARQRESLRALGYMR